MGKLEYEDLTYRIRGAFFNIYNTLGSGFKESIYHNALKEEFDDLKLRYEEKKRIQINYKGKKVGIYEPDFVVDGKVIIELKAVPSITSLFEKQLYSYLRGTKYKIGLLVNFGADKLEIKRRVYG